MRPLAEIVAEGRGLQREIEASDLLSGQRAEVWRAYDRFARNNFARLLAVAEAAMEWEQADDEYVNAEPAVQMRRLIDAEAALRAVIRGAAAAPGKETR